jgi:hypothetical protein
MTPALLLAEIVNDPTGLGLSTPFAAGQFSPVVAALNLVRASIEVDRPSAIVATHEVFEAIVLAEWNALTNAEKDRVRTVLSLGTVNLRGANTIAQLGAAFAAGSTTRTALLALAKRKGSRAEQVFEPGTVVTLKNVADARDSS